MATIRFDQCSFAFRQDRDIEELQSMPVLQRVSAYEEILTARPGGTFSTTDENFILVAQWMKRHGRLAELTLVSVCSCGAASDERVIQTDRDGDMDGEPHHGFFGQRLKYLR